MQQRPSSFPPQHQSPHGSEQTMQPPPQEQGSQYRASAYVFLACSDSSYMSGQVLHLNGGEIVNG